MAGKVRNLINRSGRYHARLVVPKDQRGIVGKSELRTSLADDYREALKLLPSAVARIQHQIAQAERQTRQGRTIATPARYPLAPDQIAHSHYTQRLAFDDELRNDPRYPSVGIDDVLVNRLRMAIAGRAGDDELVAWGGAQIERFRAVGNLDAEPGSDEWRVIARALCSAELEALERLRKTDPATLTDPQRVARFLYLQRQAFGGKLGGVFGVAADRPSRFSLSRLELILEAAHERLESVIFENLDWLDLIRRCDGSKTLFYLDLPYWGGESDYRCRFAAARVALSARCPSSSRGRTRLSENICA